MKYIKNIPVELCFWLVALMLLATANPHDHHFTLCPLANLGLSWCPGCGLGRSITSIFHGEIQESFAQHWFGIPALILISYRILQLAKQLINKEPFKLKLKEG